MHCHSRCFVTLGMLEIAFLRKVYRNVKIDLRRWCPHLYTYRFFNNYKTHNLPLKNVQVDLYFDKI